MCAWYVCVHTYGFRFAKLKGSQFKIYFCKQPQSNKLYKCKKSFIYYTMHAYVHITATPDVHKILYSIKHGTTFIIYVHTCFFFLLSFQTHVRWKNKFPFFFSFLLWLFFFCCLALRWHHHVYQQQYQYTYNFSKLLDLMLYAQHSAPQIF